MNKLVIVVLFSLFPTLVLADGLSFAPPPTDFSVVFLGNLFGTVDGVLKSSGSQILGAMFAVFNSAVLALGGIIIMYTLMVSTMNTAHEGQMLGQKWSSIWIPIRSTLGLVLLIPKASGYCLMQIFIMWIVVQGVGAADKVWEAALSYLNKGGVIIKAQANPTEALTSSSSSGVYQGAMSILAGEVCMLAVQKQLENTRASYIKDKQDNMPPCFGHHILPDMANLCDNNVPDFIDTVNVVKVQNDQVTADGLPKPYSVQMPNFDSNSPYYRLNGICGTIKWAPITGLQPCVTDVNQCVAAAKTLAAMNSCIKDRIPAGCTPGIEKGLSESQLKTIQMSRAIALQQMYVTFSSIARIMVNNNPTLTSFGDPPQSSKNYSLNAVQQFGVPYTVDGKVCLKYQDNCVSWGAAPTEASSGKRVLFTGTEFQGAIADYNGIIAPAMNLVKMANSTSNEGNSRAFISKANTEGWLMAGSYFFDLVKLNGNAQASAKVEDVDSGLKDSEGKFFGRVQETGDCATDFRVLCTWFGSNAKEKLQQIGSTLDGTFSDVDNKGNPIEGTPVKVPLITSAGLSDFKVEDGKQSASVYAFVNNSVMVKLPGQPGMAPLEFANVFHFQIVAVPFFLSNQNFPCGGFMFVCVGRLLGNLFYNVILKNLINALIATFMFVIKPILMMMMFFPLVGMSDIFKQGIQTLNEPGQNPIVALANMGVMYVNFASNLWLMITSFTVAAAAVAGPTVIALIMMAIPIVLSWLSIMVGIGFVTAFYIPLLPYMIFTFGSLAWFIAVIEAMVAGPIVALGVTHPEGHEAFGKGESAIMIIMNVFLRPSLMIIGYIAGIALCYVGVWVLNAGFDHAISYMQVGAPAAKDYAQGNWNMLDPSGRAFGGIDGTPGEGGRQDYSSGTGKYDDWSSIYAYFFSVLLYVTMYLVIVQKAFTLIGVLPDKVLRWIGGSPESAGQEAMQWGEQEVKGKVGESGKEISSAQGQSASKMASAMGKGLKDSAQSGKGSTKADVGDTNESKPSPPDGGT